MEDEATPDRTAILISFGSAIRRLRQTRGISQEELAERCGLDRTYIGGIERGERNVGLVNVQRISDALSVPVSVLFHEYETEK
jgi:transcriptional regulator with XRE-family HTH domain